MRSDTPGRIRPSRLNRREFVRISAAGVGASALIAGGRRPAAAAASPYPDWLPASTKPPKRGGVLTRASAWDPPVIDPRHTQSVGLFQFAGLTSNRLVRHPFSDEATNPNDLTLKGDLAESWSANADHRVWTFKLRQGVKWQNVAPLNGRELTAADVKYCYEAYAKEGVQAFTFQEIEGMETPDKYTLRVHLKTPNTLFPQNVAEPVAVIFSREVLEEDGDLKKRLIGTGPYILNEHTRKVRVVLQRNPDYFDTGRPYVDEYVILSTPDSATRTAAFRTGQSDFLPLQSPSEVEAVRKTNPAAVVQALTPSITPFGLALAQDKPPLNDVRVRRALSLAIDRQKQHIQQDLRKNLNNNVKISKLDYTSYYGRYVEGKWDGLAWGFQSGHAVGLDERTYVYMHSKSTKNFFRVNDPIIDELTVKLRQAPDRADQRATARRIVDREYDQVLRVWMPHGSNFVLFQPHLRNAAGGVLRGTIGYGSPTIARLWIDK